MNDKEAGQVYVLLFQELLAPEFIGLEADLMVKTTIFQAIWIGFTPSTSGRGQG